MCKYPHIIENKGLHIHFGDGGVEKKGSSAGVAVLVSMLSAVLERPVGNCAFTGEIDLMGNIFTVGGVREKLIAAEAAGCEAAFVPEGNYRGFEDRYSDINIKIIPVSHIDDVTKVIWKLQSE